MTTLRKLIRKQMHDMTLGELRQALLRTSIELNDYIDLYNKEYQQSTFLQSRIDNLKCTQRNAHLPFKGLIE